MEKTKLDQVFEKQLYSLEVKPQKGTWQRIAQQLPPKPASKKGPYFLGLLLVTGLMLPALPLQQTALRKTPPFLMNIEKQIDENNTQNKQKTHTYSTETFQKNEEKSRQVAPKNISPTKISSSSVTSSIPSSEAGETRRVAAQAPDSLLFLGTKPVLPAHQKRKHVKIEVTIHPDAFLQSDSLQQAAPEARPRIIQSLLKQLKGITLQEN